jgi:hypothetical protein
VYEESKDRAVMNGRLKRKLKRKYRLISTSEFEKQATAVKAICAKNTTSERRERHICQITFKTQFLHLRKHKASPSQISSG